MRVKKRDGNEVIYDAEKICIVLRKAMSETKLGINEEQIAQITNNIWEYFKERDFVTVDDIQDQIEMELMHERKDVAKQYIIYRSTRDRERGKAPKYKFFDDEFLTRYKHATSPLGELGNFVYYRTYSRYLPGLNRREYWWETCARTVDYNCSLAPNTTKEEAKVLYDNMFHLRQFLSGRTMWIGGTEVVKKSPMANYNCSFLVMDDIACFYELTYLLMIGTGVGLRIKKEDVEKLPVIRNNYTISHKEYAPKSKVKRLEHTKIVFEGNNAIVHIGDSKTGWATAINNFMLLLSEPQYKHFSNIIMVYDSVRPQGEKLKTFGGTASGHQAIKDMFVKIDKVFKNKVTNSAFKLKPIDVLDVCNIIGEGVVVGGVRRTAEIILFDSDDEECISAKSKIYECIDGNWKGNPDLLHRSMSNNSIYYTSKPSREQLHWQMEMMKTSGEPAFINQEAAAKRRPNFQGVNPCAEVLLDSKQMCNLTTINVMAFVEGENLDVEGLIDAQALSARAGYRMTLIDLELPEWNMIQKRDKLIGCSLTGWQDMVNATKMPKDDQAFLLRLLRKVAHVASKEYAEQLNNTLPLLTTTVKPEGTLSQLPTVSSGVHYSHSPYYIRRIRVNASDPIVKVCKELDYIVLPEIGQEFSSAKTLVVEFPVKAPEGITKYDVSAIEQLENYKMFMENYVDHNCSITVHVRDNEWEEVEQWVWDNWESMVGISFINLDDNFYALLPYEAIDEEEYLKRKEAMRPFVPGLISKYETQEETKLIDDECSSGSCPIR